MSKKTIKDLKILDLENSNPCSFKDFKQDNLSMVIREYILFKDIVDRNILSKNELEKLLKFGDLKVFYFKKKKYIKIMDLSNYLNKK